MGTRGIIIIKVNGRYFCYYNPYDSYPSWLGHYLIVELFPYVILKELMCKKNYDSEEINFPGTLSEIKNQENLHNYQKNVDLNNFDAEYFYIIDFDNDIMVAFNFHHMVICDLMNYEQSKEAMGFFESMDEGDKNEEEYYNIEITYKNVTICESSIEKCCNALKLLVSLFQKDIDGFGLLQKLTTLFI